MFRAAYFSPTFSKYNGTTVAGAQWFESSRKCGVNRSAPEISSIFTQGTVILVAVKNLSVPSESFVWDGSWFGHPGTELIDQYAGTLVRLL